MLYLVTSTMLVDGQSLHRLEQRAHGVSHCHQSQYNFKLPVQVVFLLLLYITITFRTHHGQIIQMFPPDGYALGSNPFSSMQC